RAPVMATGVTTVSGRRVVFLEGSIGEAVSACVVSADARRRVAAQLRVLTSESAAVVVPKRFKSPAFDIALVDTDGDVEYVGVDGSAPRYDGRCCQCLGSVPWHHRIGDDCPLACLKGEEVLVLAVDADRLIVIYVNNMGYTALY